jgi:hypothetical protein
VLKLLIGALATFSSAIVTLERCCANTLSPDGATRSRIEACSFNKDKERRLDCFDTLAKEILAKSTISAEDYQVIEYVDLKTDIASMRGKRISVKGFMLLLGENLVIYKEAGQMSAIFANIDNVPRDERRQFMNDCGSGCVGTVKGKIGDVMMQPGIKVEHIEFE